MPFAVGAIGISPVGGFGDFSVAQPSRYLISGVTRNAVGAVLGNCTVEVFETVTNLLRGTTISDATGNYQIEIIGDRGLTLFANAYLAGSPDVAGTTINTLTAS